MWHFAVFFEGPRTFLLLNCPERRRLYIITLLISCSGKRRKLLVVLSWICRSNEGWAILKTILSCLSSTLATRTQAPKFFLQYKATFQINFHNSAILVRGVQCEIHWRDRFSSVSRDTTFNSIIKFWNRIYIWQTFCRWKSYYRG